MDVVEMDQIIAQRQGMSISDIFETYGEQVFPWSWDKSAYRNAVTQQCCDLLRRWYSNERVQCSRDEEEWPCCSPHSKPETILDRVKNNHDRPLIENNKTVPFIADLMEKRRAKYEAAADIIIETDGKNELEICEELVHRLRTMDEK